MAKKKSTKKKATKKAAKKAAKKSKASKASSKKGRSPSAANKAGKVLERDVAKALRHIFPDAERELEYQASNTGGVDLQGTHPLGIQCKNHAGYCSISKIREVNTDDPEIVPVLITQGVRLPAVACLYFTDFVKLLESAFANRELGKTVDSLIELDTSIAVLGEVTEKGPALDDASEHLARQAKEAQENIDGLNGVATEFRCTNCKELTVSDNHDHSQKCNVCSLEFFEGTTYCMVCDMDMDSCECAEKVIDKMSKEEVGALLDQIEKPKGIDIGAPEEPIRIADQVARLPEGTVLTLKEAIPAQHRNTSDRANLLGLALASESEDLKKANAAIDKAFAQVAEEKPKGIESFI